MKETLRMHENSYGRVVPAGLSSWIAVRAALLVLGGLVHQARAADASVVQAGVSQIAQASSPLPSAVTAGALSEPRVSLYDRFDPLRVKGWNIPTPGPADTVDRGLFGVRDKLADAGIGYLFFTNTYFADNLLRHGLPAGNNRQNQLYSGQLPTVWSANFGFVTYDLSRYGVPDGQVMVGGTYLTTNWNPLGPRTTSLATATYYQTLFNKAVELKIGYVANSLEFLGTYVGGSLAGGVFGPNASIPVEQGENSTVFSTPGINVKVNLPAHLYTKLGVQRAISPDGTVVEHNQNTSAVRFKVPNAGVFVIDEAGYQVAAAPGVMRTWVRAAASYTSSNYRDYSSGFLLPAVRSDHNYGLYLLADRQLLQTAPHTGAAAQGIYAGFSVMYAPPALNRFSQYYEARLYGVGLIPNRPTDLLSLVVTDNVFSSDVVNTARRLRLPTHDNSLALTASYSAHVYPGVNLNAGVSYINNPTSITYTGSTGSALNILLGTVTFF